MIQNQVDWFQIQVLNHLDATAYRLVIGKNKSHSMLEQFLLLYPLHYIAFAAG